MINDSMKSNKMIGMIQPKSSTNKKLTPELHKVGASGKSQALEKLKMVDF